MRAKWFLVCVFGLATSTIQASTFIDLGSSICSGDQSLDSSNGLALSCTGDFSLGQGSLISDTAITLFSKGRLSLSNFKLSAPRITLNTEDSLHIGSDVSFAGNGNQPSILISSPESRLIGGNFSPTEPSLSSGGDITVTTGRDISAGRGGAGIVKISPPSVTFLARPPISLVPPAGGQISLSSGGITIMSAGTLASVPLPPSFLMLLSGLLLLVSGSRRSMFRK
ncbi:hypothetical protein ACH518_05340 [Methylomonas sp. HW2-6]|uniref:hypothetical protein n=1 Tax=Methylomonas sp. HW2-6 TaxID=3376687 RepID=UPI0040430F4F